MHKLNYWQHCAFSADRFHAAIKIQQKQQVQQKNSAIKEALILTKKEISRAIKILLISN